MLNDTSLNVTSGSGDCAKVTHKRYISNLCKSVYKTQITTVYKKSYYDFPIYLSSIPVISARVKKVIEPFVKDEVEFLPLMVHADLHTSSLAWLFVAQSREVRDLIILYEGILCNLFKHFYKLSFVNRWRIGDTL